MPEEDQPATKSDVRELRDRMDGIGGNLSELSERMDGIGGTVRDLREHIDSVELRLAQRLERAENAILAGFHSYAKREGVRTTALEMRLAEVESRLIDIERALGLRRQQ